MTEWLNNLADTFTRCFIDGDQWKWLLEGLGNTMIITVFALLIGIVIGLVIAAVRSTYDMNGAAMKKKGGPSYVLLKIANWICSLFLTFRDGSDAIQFRPSAPGMGTRGGHPSKVLPRVPIQTLHISKC